MDLKYPLRRNLDNCRIFIFSEIYFLITLQLFLFYYAFSLNISVKYRKQPTRNADKSKYIAIKAEKKAIIL